MQLPAPAVPRLIREEQQIHRIAAGVKVSRFLLPTELADVPAIGIDLVGEEGGSSLQCRHFSTGLGVVVVVILLCVCFHWEGKRDSQDPLLVV